jgi:hypothetical protein
MVKENRQFENQKTTTYKPKVAASEYSQRSAAFAYWKTMWCSRGRLSYTSIGIDTNRGIWIEY